MVSGNKKNLGSFNPRAWIIAVSMGYGHQRTAFPLRHLAPGEKIINANDYPGIPEKDRRTWKTMREGYEFVSRFKRVPLIGELAFAIFDEFQKIMSYYPKRDLSRPNLSLKHLFFLIKRGWGRHLIEKLKASLPLKKPLPLITTFFTPAFMAEVFDYPGKIFCVICDADISRTWASFVPQKSKIKYFAPTSWAASRLKLYGVKEENIFLTGYPLPKGNIGTENLEILKHDFSYRLLNLDPNKTYFQKYKALIRDYLGDLPQAPNHPLTIMFAVGGAGAQKEIGIKIARSLAVKIWAGEVKLILVAGIRKRVKEYFEKNIEKFRLGGSKNIEIIFEKDIQSYFQKFNQALRTTDILWTKPSELSFYSALGIPIIIAPPVGSQEDLNQKWLLRIGAGMLQENPKYTQQWLFDFLKSGRFAEIAMEGFIKGEKLGTFNIEKIISQNL